MLTPQTWEALLSCLDDMEDSYIAERILDRVRRGEERIYSSEEMDELLRQAE